MKKKDLYYIEYLKNQMYTEGNLNEIISILESKLALEEEKDTIICTTLARAYYEKKEYQKAIFYYQKALTKVPTCSASLFGLFKCFIRLENYKQALLYLKQYQQINKNADITLLSTLIQNLLNPKFSSIALQNQYLNIALKNGSFLDKYHEMIENYNQKNWAALNNCLQILKKQSRMEKIWIDFDLITFLVTKQMTQDLDYVYELLKEAYQKKDAEQIKNYLMLVCKYPLKNRKLIFQCVYVLVNQYYMQDATTILKKMKLLLKEEQVWMRWIEVQMSATKKYRGLDENTRIQIQKQLEKGKKAYQNHETEKALSLFQEGYLAYLDPIFLYYIGKMYYKQKKYEEAEPYLLQYLNEGVEKGAKACLYLVGIAKRKQDFTMMQTYYDLCKNYNQFLDEEVEIFHLVPHQKTSISKEC